MTRPGLVFNIGRIRVSLDEGSAAQLPVSVAQPGSTPNKDATVEIRLRGIRKLSPREGEMFGPCVVGEGSVGMIGPGGRWIEVSPQSETLLGSSSVEVEYDLGIPAPWVLEHLLEPLAFLLNIRHGMAFVHAAAFEVEGRGVILTGWTRIGKTQILLHFLEKGAAILSDDWAGVAEGRIWPYQRHLKLSRFNLSARPDLEGRAARMADCAFLDPESIGARIGVATAPTHSLMIHRFAGSGLLVTESSISVQIERMLGTLSYAISHYIGALFAASQLPGRGEMKELTQFAADNARTILFSSLAACDASEVACGHDSDNLLVKAIRDCIGIPDDRAD